VNSPVNSVFQARAESYLTLPCGTNEEPTAWTREAPLASTEIITRTAPDRSGCRSVRRYGSGPHTASVTHTTPASASKLSGKAACQSASFQLRATKPRGSISSICVRTLGLRPTQPQS